MPIRINFQIEPCLRCGADRILAAACANCGKSSRPGEVNAYVVRRRTMVRRINRELIEGADIRTDGADPGELPQESELSGFLHEFLDALVPLGYGTPTEGEERRLIDTLHCLETMVRRAEQTPRLRPRIAVIRATTTVLERLALLWPAYAEALTSPTMHLAQTRSREAQNLIDTAFADLEEYRRLEKLAEIVQDPDRGTLMERTLALMDSMHPELSLFEIASLGSAAASTAIDLPVDAGHGAGYLVLHVLSGCAMHPDRLRSVIIDASKVCEESQHMEQVADMPGALLGLASSDRALYECFTVVETLSNAKLNQDAAIRRLVKIYGELFEDVACSIFAWYALLTGVKSRPYAKLIRSGAADLARSFAGDERLKEIFQGADVQLRHAAQHAEAVEIQGSAIHFKLNVDRDPITYDQLIDTVLKLLESLSASAWALTAALSRRAIEVPRLPGSLASESSFLIARAWLAGNEFELLDAEENDGHWLFTIGETKQSRLSLAYALTSSDTSRPLSVTVGVNEINDSVEVSMSHLRTYMEDANGASPGIALLTLLELRRACRWRGKPLLSESDLTYAAAAIGLEVLAAKEAIPSLRRVLRLAVEERYPGVEALVRRVFAAQRDISSSQNHPLVAQLESLMRSSVAPSMPEGSTVTCWTQHASGDGPSD